MTKTHVKECCATCRYMGFKSDAFQGPYQRLCLRFPPQVVVMQKSEGHTIINGPFYLFPAVTNYTTWCGEWKLMPELAELGETKPESGETDHSETP